MASLRATVEERCGERSLATPPRMPTVRVARGIGHVEVALRVGGRALTVAAGTPREVAGALLGALRGGRPAHPVEGYVYDLLLAAAQGVLS